MSDKKSLSCIYILIIFTYILYIFLDSIFFILLFMSSRSPTFYDEQKLLPYNWKSIGPYRSEYKNWHTDKNERNSVNDEEYKYRKYSPNDVDERLYPRRTRRYSFVDGYRNDGVEPLEDLEDERLSEENDDKNVYNRQFLFANEFLPNEKSSDYTLLQPSSDDERNEREYERVFSRKYKHRKKPPHREFLDSNASMRLDNEKRTAIARDEIDYEDGGTDENNSGEIDESDTSSKLSDMYTEGGVVRPLRHKTDTSGEFMFNQIVRRNISAFC